MCFGYAQFVHDKSRGRYAFLEPLADSAVDQISIEAAQPGLDLGVLKCIGRQSVILGVIDLGTAAIESAEEVARASLRVTSSTSCQSPSPAPGLRHEIPDAGSAPASALAAGAAIVRAEQRVSARSAAPSLQAQPAPSPRSMPLRMAVAPCCKSSVSKPVRIMR